MPETPLTANQFEDLVRSLLRNYASDVCTDALTMPFEEANARRTGHANGVVSILRREFLRAAAPSGEGDTQLDDAITSLLERYDETIHEPNTYHGPWIERLREAFNATLPTPADVRGLLVAAPLGAGEDTKRLIAWVASDENAMTFQSLGQYRNEFLHFAATNADITTDLLDAEDATAPSPGAGAGGAT